MSFANTQTLSDAEFLYYSRQLLLPDWSESQQLALKHKTVLIIGLGGLGCPVATYLAGAGVGQLWLCDGDKIELSNLPRQPLYRTTDVGAFKAEAAKATLSAYNPHIKVTALINLPISTCCLCCCQKSIWCWTARTILQPSSC